MRWLKILGGALVAYTFVGAITASDQAIQSIQRGEVIHWALLIQGKAIEEYTCALFAPVLFWLVDRFPIDRQTWKRNAPFLAVACFALAAFKYLGFYPLWMAYWHHPAQAALIIASSTLEVGVDFVSVVGVAHAIRYYQRARDRERSEAALRVQLSQAQLEALKSQLHPHFLFNTLNSIATLMHCDVATADEMLTQLSDLLRETLRYPGTHEIPLSEEIELAERYLGIVRARFRDRLTVVYHVAPDVRMALVPHFILQPLIENALEHGIALEPGPGCVTITATRDGDRLHMAIVDDGPGLAPGAANGGGNGVGLVNTRARLAELYGDRQALTLEAASPRGVRATVSLPYRV